MEVASRHLTDIFLVNMQKKKKNVRLMKAGSHGKHSFFIYFRLDKARDLNACLSTWYYKYKN